MRNIFEDMGDSACLMRPFSYSEAKEDSPALYPLGLGQSVSLGRYATESLAWERWSKFSHNKYVEEAERYSKPGSVAAKKAFFEAHYKTLAAKKAAALLEKANAEAKVAEGSGESEVEDGVHETTPQDSDVTNSNSQTSLFDYDGKENDSDSPRLENSEEGDDSVTEKHDLLKNHVRKELFDKNGVIDNAEIENLELMEAIQAGKVENSRPLWEIVEIEPSEGSHMEKPLLKSDNSSQEEAEVTSRKKPPRFSSRVPASVRTSKVSSLPAKDTAPIHLSKGNHLSPLHKTSTVEISDSRKPTPKSSHKSINFTPAKEFSKLKSSIIKKIDGSRNASNYKASKECVTPLKSPSKASTSGRSKQTSVTPWPENRCASSPISSSESLSIPPRRKWQFLPTDCSKFFSACRKKSESPGMFASFSLRTEERAARRKQRLEVKFNAGQEPRVQKHTTLKEKAGTELKKLRPSCCFKARPLPDFYKERRTPKDEVSEAPLVKPFSSDLGRKSTPSNTSNGQSKISLQRQKSSNKNTYPKHVLEKKNQSSVRSINSRDALTAHENTSPNIQS